LICSGYHTRKMFQEYGSKEPELAIISGCFTVTAYAIEYKDMNYSTESVYKDGVKEILSVIRQNPAITTKALSNQLNIPFRTVQRYLESLKKANKIVRIDGRKNGKWVIMEGKFAL